MELTKTQQMVEEALRQAQQGLGPRQGETATVSTNTTGGAVGEDVWEIISETPSAQMIRALEQQVSDLTALNKQLVENWEAAEQGRQTLLQERDGWTKTINELKSAVRDTVDAAAESERARLVEKQEMQEQLVRVQETKEEAHAIEVQQLRREEAFSNLKKTTDEALAGIRSSLSKPGGEEEKRSMAIDDLVAQMTSVQVSGDEQLQKRLELVEARNVELEAQVAIGEDALAATEAQLFAAQAKANQVESTLANYRAMTPARLDRPSTASSIGRARSSTELPLLSHGVDSRFKAPLDDETEEERELREMEEKEAKALERQKRRDIEYARLRSEGRLSGLMSTM